MTRTAGQLPLVVEDISGKCQSSFRKILCFVWWVNFPDNSLEISSGQTSPIIVQRDVLECFTRLTSRNNLWYESLLLYWMTWNKQKQIEKFAAAEAMRNAIVRYNNAVDFSRDLWEDFIVQYCWLLWWFVCVCKCLDLSVCVCMCRFVVYELRKKSLIHLSCGVWRLLVALWQDNRLREVTSLRSK